MNSTPLGLKKILSLIIVLVLIVLGIFFVIDRDSIQKEVVSNSKNYKDISYTIDGESLQLKDGYSEVELAPNSASKVITKYFGNEIKKDLNGDGLEDVAFILTQKGGGSGTFFYVVGAIATEQGYVGSHAVFLGDRISPQVTESGPGNSIIVNYMDRDIGEDMSVPPSVGKSFRLLLDTESMQFGEVAQDFEGEADPSRMSLGMKTWKWVRAEYNDGKVALPKRDVFTLTFNTDNTFGVSSDCNGVGGKYTATKSTILFNEMVWTEMYCEGSQEAEFRNILENTGEYLFTSKGELVLNLKYDSGSIYFR